MSLVSSLRRLAIMAAFVTAAATAADAADQPIPGVPYIEVASVSAAPNGELILTLGGVFPDSLSCWAVTGYPDSGFRVEMFRTDSVCNTPQPPWTLQSPIGAFAPGFHTMRIQLLVYLVPDGPPVRYEGYFQFTIPPSFPALPYVTEVRIAPADADSVDPVICPDDSIRVTLIGLFPNQCHSVTGIDVAYYRLAGLPGGPHVILTVDQGNCHEGCELRVVKPFEASIVLPPRLTGEYLQGISVVVTDCAKPESTTVTSTAIPFSVAKCPVDSISYLSRIVVSPAHGDSARPICNTDSVRVRFEGWLPDQCGSFEKIDVAESFPPQFVVWLDLTNCEQGCAPALKYWTAEVVLPPFYAGHYELPVQVVAIDCTFDNIVSRQRTTAGFDVVECPPLPACFLPGFTGDGRACNVVIGPDGTAQLDLTLMTTTALAGVQGAFVLDPPGLEIANLEPTGAAANMRLAWRKTSNGARYTLFSEDGSTFGPCPLSNVRCDARIIRITVKQSTRTPAGVTYLHPTEMLGSGPNGEAVYGCPTLNHFAPIVARICTENACDVNHDGHADIRDLVLMVNCLNLDDRSMMVPCPLRDCTGDSTASLEDVLCCARRILNSPPCVDCPPDSTPPRPAPVEVSLGLPAVSGDRTVVPVRVTGAQHLGAARLDLMFPSDRYEVEDLSLSGAPSSWLSLHEVRGDRVVAGLVRIAPEYTFEANQELVLLLTLRLKVGQTPGGEVRSAGGEFSDGNGALLQVPLAVVQPLAGPPRLALSEGRPNPFSDETVFAITLDQAAEVTIGIYDLGGRLVATPQRGLLQAGSHPIVWNGRDAAGETLPNGVYFALAISGEARDSRKVVLLRGK